MRSSNYYVFLQAKRYPAQVSGAHKVLNISSLVVEESVITRSISYSCKLDD